MTHWFLLYAVHRHSDTLRAALASFHAAGIERIVMLPDNGTLGPMGNTHRALVMGVQQGAPGDQICVLQDDMVLCRDTLLALSRRPLVSTAVLFTPEQNVEHHHRDKAGWVPLSPSWGTWGGMVMLSWKTARAVIEHPFWLRHLMTTRDRRQSDAALFETLRLMDEPCLQHVPSLSDHIGGSASTIGNDHGDETRGYRYNEWG